MNEKKPHIHKPFDESELTDAEKDYLNSASERERDLILAGYPIVISSLVNDSVYSFNMRIYAVKGGCPIHHYYSRAATPSVAEWTTQPKGGDTNTYCGMCAAKGS